MMTMKLLVKIAVMMMAPGSAPAPPKARGRETPSSSSSSLTFSLDGRRVSLWSLVSMAWEGESPSESGPVSLSISVFAFPDLAFHRFLYSRRSVTLIGLKFEHNFHPDIRFLAAKEGQQLPYGVSMRVRGAPAPCLMAPSGIVSR